MDFVSDFCAGFLKGVSDVAKTAAAVGGAIIMGKKLKK